MALLFFYEERDDFFRRKPIGEEIGEASFSRNEWAHLVSSAEGSQTKRKGKNIESKIREAEKPQPGPVWRNE